MKLKILVFFLIFTQALFSSTFLQKKYYIKNNYVLLSDIVHNSKKKIVLYKFDIAKHTKRIKSSTLVEKLKSYGYTQYAAQSNYVQFTQKSPVDTSKIASYIQKTYTQKYTSIVIKQVHVHPRSFLKLLPKDYKVALQKRYYLSDTGIVYIKTKDKKKIFFNYEIEAKINLYVAKKDIKKGEEISIVNSKKKSIILNKFRAMPLEKISKESLEAKHNIKEGKILTKLDVTGLYLIRRGSNINITLFDGTIAISLFAKALQNGKLTQSIYAITANGKKIRVVVTGRNRAEIIEQSF